MESSPLLKTKILRKFNPLNRLNEKQLILLSSNHEVRQYKKRSTVMTVGSSDNVEYFLIDGKIEVTAKDGKKKVVEAGTLSAMSPIAHLQPRQYDVQVIEKATFLLIDWMVLAQFIREAPKSGTNSGAAVSVDMNDPIDLVRGSFKHDLSSNNLELPSIPAIANHIRQAVASEDASCDLLSKLISADPVMVVKIISASNSPLYRGESKVLTCSDAVSRLGVDTTKQLVNVYALRELFGSKLGCLQARMQILWQTSQSVAAIAHTLATMTKTVDPEQALLAGLTHDVGVIPVLQYADSHTHFVTNVKDLEKVIEALRAELGGTMLEQWGWPEDMLNVVTNTGNWQYESGQEEPDLADIVIIAQVHAMLGSSYKQSHPPMDEITSFKKLESIGLTPSKSIQLLKDAKEQIQAVQKLVSG
ncbi:hypothetical protein A9Q99_21605 [Gammaproteobacteria bacterium 45_16_T64]|nr:hypothetical protein A9Q99_21605 [Gammaproteobacteria bacterium 45_16_T64]